MFLSPRETILVALYSDDPHLNWRQAHLLHQYWKGAQVAARLTRWL